MQKLILFCKYSQSKNIKTILYKAKGNGLLVATDKSAEYGEELLGEV